MPIYQTNGKQIRGPFVTMFGSARDSIDPMYKEHTAELFRKIADSGFSMCFGGGSTGLMGAAASGYQSSANPERFLLGVAPTWMQDFEPLYPTCDALALTVDMEERKRILRDASTVYIMCPGGQGTVEEWAVCAVSVQLDQIPDHSKIVLYNDGGFYDSFVQFLDEMTDKGFLSRHGRDVTVVCRTQEEILAYLEAHRDTIESNLSRHGIG